MEGDIPPDFAKRLLAIKFSEAQQARYRLLAEKAQLDQLSDDERVELDEILTANDLLTILHAKARGSL